MAAVNQKQKRMPGKQYEYIDLDFINAQADGDPDFLVEIVSTFLTTVPANLEKLRAAVDTGNHHDILFYAHKLKGSFNFIGCSQINEMFGLMEQSAVDDANSVPMKSWLTTVVGKAAKIISELEDLSAGQQGKT